MGFSGRLGNFSGIRLGKVLHVSVGDSGERKMKLLGFLRGDLEIRGVRNDANGFQRCTQGIFGVFVQITWGIPEEIGDSVQFLWGWFGSAWHPV